MHRFKSFIFDAALCILVFFAFVAVKNVVVSRAIKNGLSETFSAPVSIKDVDVSIGFGHIRIEGLSIGNPAGFEDDDFVYIPQIDFVWDPASLIKQKELYVYLIDLNIDHLNVVKNIQGKVNLKEMGSLQGKDEKGYEKLFKIKDLVLTIKDVYFIEYFPNKKPLIKKYSVNIKDTAFTDLYSLDDVGKLVVARVTAQTDLGNLLNITVAPLTTMVNSGAQAAKGVVKGVFGLLFLPFSSQNR